MKSGIIFFRGIVRCRFMRLFMVLLCSFACFLAFFSLNFSRDTIELTRSDFFSKTGDVDIFVYSDDLPQGELKRLIGEYDGISFVSEGIEYTARCVCVDGMTRTVRFLAYDGNTAVSPIFENDGEYALAYGYYAGFDPNSVASLVTPKGTRVTVDNIAYMPSYMSVYVDRYTASSDGEIVDIYTSFENIKKLCGSSLVNRAAVVCEADADISDVLSALESSDFEYCIALDDVASVASSDELYDTICAICRWYLFVLFGIGIVFVCVFLCGVALRSKKTIAVLRADGVSHVSIFIGLFLSSASAMLFGAMIALPAGYAFAREITSISLENMGIVYNGVSIYIEYIIYAFVLCIFIALVSAFVSVVSVSRYSVLGLKRSYRAKKYTNILDALTICVCSSIALVLVLTTCAFRDSLDALETEMFDERCNYSAQVIYSDFVPVSEITKLQSFGEAEPIIIGNAVLSFGETKCDVSGMCISADSKLIRFDNINDEPVDIKNNQLVLADETAALLGASVGDLVKVSINHSGTKIQIICLVSDISLQNTAYVQLASIETVEAYLDSSGVMNGALVKLSSGEEQSFLRYAKSLEDVYAVQLTGSMRELFRQRYSGTEKLIGIIVAQGIMLGFLIFALISYASFQRNRKRNRILQMLGEHSLLLTAKDAVPRLIGAISGIFGGIWLSIYADHRLLDVVSTETVRYPFVLNSDTVIFGVILTVFYLLICTAVYYFAIIRDFKKR